VSINRTDTTLAVGKLDPILRSPPQVWRRPQMLCSQLKELGVCRGHAVLHQAKVPLGPCGAAARHVCAGRPYIPTIAAQLKETIEMNRQPRVDGQGQEAKGPTCMAPSCTAAGLKALHLLRQQRCYTHPWQQLGVAASPRLNCLLKCSTYVEGQITNSLSTCRNSLWRNVPKHAAACCWTNRVDRMHKMHKHDGCR
jgi:hypothetical protein